MHTLEFLFEATSILAAAVAVVLVSSRVRIPPVVGFLISGILIGPSGLAMVPSVEEVEVFAEIGVVLLLFVIGLQLKPAEMKVLGRSFLVGGSLQWALTTGLTMAVVIGLGLPPAHALFIGFVVSLSSTAVVLKEYQELRESGTPQGRIVLGVLLFQDLLIVPMIALTPVLAGSVQASASSLALRFGGGLAAVGIVFFVGRALMPRLMRLIAGTRIRELYVLGAIMTCLAMAWFTARLEFSLALGAFLAGLLVAETEYSHQVVADVAPFRDLFASMFFISVGMLIDLPLALAKLPLLIGLTAALVVGKAMVATVAFLIGGYTLRIALICGFGLSQIGEFSFVLMEVGRANDLLQGDRFQVLLVAAVLTVALTPFLVRLAPMVAWRVAAVAGDLRSDESSADHEELAGHVVVVGYGMSGGVLARVLNETGIPYLVVELNPDAVRRARDEGVPVLFGDACRKEILTRARVESARMVVFGISDFSTMRRSLRMTRDLAPSVEIVVRTGRFTDIDELRAGGADQVVAEEFESAIEIFTRVLAAYHIPRNVIRAETRALRGETYRMLRSSPLGQAPEAVLAALEAGTTDLYRIATDGYASGRTLRELALREKTGTSVIAVVRGEQSQPNPPPDLELEVGDCLVIVGAHEEIDEAFLYLDGGSLS